MIRAAWLEAVTRFLHPTDTEVQAELVAHAQGRTILDTVFPPDECDLAHADRAMLHGRNMVPDERWKGTA